MNSLIRRNIMRSFTSQSQSTMKLSNVSYKLPKNRAKKIFQESDCVCFDVDSTVVTEEGIDILAKACGKYEQVKALTNQAMNGDMKFQDALQARLQLIQPTRQILNDIIYDPNSLVFTPGMQDLISTLQAQDKNIVFISGGFQQFVEVIAQKCNVPKYNIYAIELFFFLKDNIKVLIK